jgi:hypothetical protein
VALGFWDIPWPASQIDGRTAEVYRIASDGVPNGCSMLYGALVRAAWALGYDKALTYTLADEPGTSLKASGWTYDGEAGGATGLLQANPKDSIRRRNPPCSLSPRCHRVGRSVGTL